MTAIEFLPILRIAFQAIRDGAEPSDVVEEFAGVLVDAGATDDEVSAYLVELGDILTPLPEPYESVSDVILRLGVPFFVARARDPERKAARIARRQARRTAWRNRRATRRE